MTGRAGAMAARLDDTAGRLGVGPPGRALLQAAFQAAMAPRLERGLDDHHPDFLHPARTALILMDDAGIDDPITLAAAALTETRDPALSAAPETLDEADGIEGAGDAVRAVVRAVPSGADPERVREDLVVAEPAVLLVAVAERLDHARHLHLRERSEWEAYHALTCAAYAPASARAHPRLGRRLTWWCETFRERFLGG